MKLEWMRLNNFRQFYGDQTIRFSRDSIRNVTVVQGVNGAGKTALFTALNWSLYGLDADDIGELVSKRAIDEAAFGSDVDMQVQLSFRHEGERYTVTRGMSIIKTGKSSWNVRPQGEFSLDVVRADGQTRSVQNPTGRIESILPSKVRSYFFFDGEKIDQFARPSHEAEVQDAVRNILKIEVLERAMRHLGAVADEYQRELKRHASGGLEDLLDDRLRLRGELEKAQQRLTESREERTAAQRQIQEIDVRLGEIQEVQVWDEQRKGATDTWKSREREKDQLLQQIREIGNRGFFSFAGTALARAIEVLDEKRERGEIPPGIREQFVQDLLATHLCICGRPIEEESDEHRRLIEVLQQSVPSELESVVLQTAGDLRAIQPRIEGVSQQLQELMKHKARLDDEMEELSAKLDEISRHLRGGEHEEVSVLEGKRVERTERVQALSSDIGRYQERIENLRGQLQQVQADIDKAQVSEERAKGIQQRFSLARKAADAIEQQFDVFAQDMRASIQTEAKSIFQRIIWKESQFEDIRLSEDYRLEVIDRWGLPARPELSAGERQVLSLAFITGMSRVTGEEAPLVMDTPFGRLSSAHREAITEQVPAIADQLVMFVTDEELRSQARANLEPRIGAEYKLEFDQATGSTTISELATSERR